MDLFKKSKLGKVTIATILTLVAVSNFSSVSGVSLEKDLSLTASEKNALDQFRKKVSPLLYRNFMKHDIYLIRWLRARDFNVQSAEAMLRTHLKWRKDNKMDTVLQEDWSDMRRDFPTTADTHDLEGRPIGVIDIYDWDIRSVTLRGISKRYLRYCDYLMENITTQVFERMDKGMNVSQWTVLGNTAGFNVVEHACPLCLPLWIQFIQSVEANYPGWMNELIVIDCPTTINIILEVTRPFMTRNTRDALKIFGPNRNKWLPYIDQRIAKDQRRRQYGGTKPPLKD